MWQATHGVQDHGDREHRFVSFRFVAAWVGREASILDPGCFALVMATGIISNAFLLDGRREVSDALFALNLVVYPWLWLLTILRAARFGAALRVDLLSPHRVFSFFTAVAATDVLGIALGVRGLTTVALLMWLFALALWLALIYIGFGVLLFVNTGNGAKVIEGGWLNAIVGTQSLVILGAQVALFRPDGGPKVLLLIYVLWVVGLALYGIFAALFSYRVFFCDLKPSDVNPIVWLIMGAAAISANAGATLVVGNSAIHFLKSIQPFVDAMTFAMWAWATWLLPLLVLLGLWKHGIHRMSISYTPMLWCIVFPLGMYAVASVRLSHIAAIPALGSLSSGMAFIALAAWAATGTALLVASWRSARAVE
ncbi:MAG TPA: tellurite resistance/C4-dicarboxylate transporter family protein [Xanthobacteraceae bacterium]